MRTHCVAMWAAWAALWNYSAVAEKLASFESAVATSAFPSGAFPATDALAVGSGYWCSSGNHAPGERVAWTGAASVAQMIAGVTINWAYGPGEHRVLTSTDGKNFEEAAGWRAASRPDVSYVETIMFDTPREVKNLAVVMRSPKHWGFFGINELSAHIQPGPSMLVSGFADGVELCLVADGGTLEVRGCLDAMASGSGAEVFNVSPTSQLVSAASGQCISIANGGVSMQDCEGAVDAGDGRSTFAISASSRVQSRAGYCLSTSAAGASAVPCSDDQGVVRVVAVPGLDLAAVAPLHDAAALLRAAVSRQSSLLGQLKRSLQACHGLTVNSSVSHPDTRLLALSKTASSAASNPAAETSQRIDAAVEIDLAAVRALISETREILAETSASM